MVQKTTPKPTTCAVGEIQLRRRGGVITWGRKIPLGDCEVQERTIGYLHFRSVDFGDTIRLSERNRVCLENVAAQERNRCVLLHLVAGTQWGREGKKNGAPTLAKVMAETEEWRREEFLKAKSASATLAGRQDPFAPQSKVLRMTP